MKNVTGWKLTGMLIAAPLMGALFCIFLPFIGFWMVGKLLVEKVMLRTRAKRIVTSLLA